MLPLHYITWSIQIILSLVMLFYFWTLLAEQSISKYLMQDRILPSLVKWTAAGFAVSSSLLSFVPYAGIVGAIVSIIAVLPCFYSNITVRKIYQEYSSHSTTRNKKTLHATRCTICSIPYVVIGFSTIIIILHILV